MREYDPKEIESKWQKEWEKEELYKAKGKGDKYYSLVEFPYPSGDGLHVGHVRSYTAIDVLSRKKRMEGFDVLYPIGWDAFGLPTENYAIKTGRQPAEITKENTDNFRKQMKALGLSFDWSREINTTDPKYYKWTQWIFLKFLERGLAYKAKTKVNWCPKDKIVLANEEVVDGHCERCGTEVEEREKEQWILKITAYADRLYKDLEKVDFPERVKAQQRNWIGPSEGALIKFDDIEVFTTRPDTIYGATFLVKAGKQDRFTGEYVTNPATKEKIPVWEAEYVMADYGTGAIMAVPAHDERDYTFAKKHNLPIKCVIEPYMYVSSGSKQRGDSKTLSDFGTAPKEVREKILNGEEWHDRLGKLIHSEGFNGREADEELKKEITNHLDGKWVTKYKLRDWIFSRQRYWGEPIPVILCEKCGIVPVPEKDLPVTLPKVENYKPTDTGESPLANIAEWVNVKCPMCEGSAKRETDVMPNWAGSSWYFLRYADPENDKEFASQKALKHWMPVDWYNGGMEHTTLHLLYSRFWNKFLFDLGLVTTDEPYKKRTSHGIVLAEGGEKMSKSKGNVINPDKIINMFGADTLRLYELFMGPFEQMVAWDDKALVGPRRFLERVWKLNNKIGNAETGEFGLHSAVKKVSEDIETLGFNTAVSSLMTWVNELEKKGEISKEEYATLLRLLAPLAPHITEELWQMLGNKDSIHLEKWPEFDEKKLVKSEVVYAIQVNGKVRSSIRSSASISMDEIENMAKNLPEIGKWLEGKEVKKVIVVPQKIVNIVTN